MRFYDQLKLLRKQKGFTIREVASRSGVSAAYISQLENGNRGLPSPEILLKLSDGLNSSYANLMQMAGYLQLADTQQDDAQTQPLNLRRLLRENELVFEGKVLSAQDKEWIDRMLTVLFWKEKDADRSK